MSTYDELKDTYQEWVESAWELSEDSANNKVYEKITWMALIHRALNTAPSDIRTIIESNLKSGISLDDFLDYLRNSIQLQNKVDRQFEGKDSEFDPHALTMLQALKSASGDVREGLLCLFSNCGDEVANEIIHFLNIKKITKSLSSEKVSLFNQNESLNKKVFTNEALRILDEAAHRAAICARDMILPVHLLRATLYSNNSLIENTIRRKLPPQIPFTVFREYIDTIAKPCQDECEPLSLTAKYFASYSIESLEKALQSMTKRGDASVTVLDLFIGLISESEDASGGRIKAIFENNQIDVKRLQTELEKRALDADVTDNYPLEIPQGLMGRDISWESRNKKYKSKKGFDILLKDVLKVLYKKKRNSVLITGQSGIGRTSLLEEIALRMTSKEYTQLVEKKLVLINCSKVSPNKKESVLNNALQFVYGKKNIILCLDGLESILFGEESEKIGAGFIDQFQYFVQKMDIQIIITISPSAYYASFNKDHRIKKLFEFFEQHEPTADLTKEIVVEHIPQWNKKYNITITKSAVDKAIQVTEQYLLSEYFPKKAMDVIEEAADSKFLEKQLTDKELFIEAEDIVKIVSKDTGIPEETLRGDTDVADFTKPLSEKVVGQDLAVKVCADELGLIKSGMKDPEKPASVILFTGLTGTGKTELAKAIANIYSATKRLVTFTMGNFSEPHSSSGLIGAPPGYIGYEQGGPLINEINKDPYCVVLLDEIEKAHPEIWKPFLNLFDEGWIVDSRNTKANATQCIFILTSNVGADILSENRSHEEVDDEVREELREVRFRGTEQKCFTPEFLARIQRIVIFKKLDREALKKIILIQLNKKKKSFKKSRNKILTIPEPIIDLFADECFNRYHRSDGKEGGRVVHKVLIEYLDSLIQKCPVEDFKLAKELIVEGDLLQKLTLRVIKDELPKQEILAIVKRLHKEYGEELNGKMQELTKNYNKAVKEYAENTDVESYLISDEALNAIYKNINNLLESK